MAGKDERVEFRCSAAEKLMFEEAAEQDGLHLGPWFRALGHERAMQVIVTPKVDGGEPAPASAFIPGYGLEED